MGRLLIVASLFLVAASPAEVVPDLEANGYYIEPGSSASEEVVSNAVFEGRASGGRLYIVVLSEEPSGGATTFSDSVLDELNEGYVLTVAPETVGFAGDGSFWSSEAMNAALDTSLSGGTDDEVVMLFIQTLTGADAVPSDGGEPSESSGGASGWVWLLIIGGAVAFFVWMSRRGSKRRAEAATAELEKVKTMARQKLAEIANDIIEMEDEVDLSDNAEAKAHYARASATYTETLARIERSPTAQDMVEVIRRLDLAIWELDAAEALLDGKPIPDKPQPPEPVQRPGRQAPAPQPVTPDRVDRRPQRQSSYAGPDMMTALLAILTMTGRGGGGPGGFAGPMRTGSGRPRMSGGGRRMGGFGRMRGGGRRR